jgi:hypothetical protein
MSKTRRVVLAEKAANEVMEIENEKISNKVRYMENVEVMSTELVKPEIEANGTHREASRVEFVAGDSLEDSLGSIRNKNKNCRLKNKIRGCECTPKYKVAQTWNDGRTRLSEQCGISPTIMLDPNGTYRVRVHENLSDWPEVFREEMRLDIKDIKEKNVRAGCELLWDGKTYTFQGYY